jgi:hypothetical protein
VSRELYINLFEQQFENNRVLCVNGDEGVGVTTVLAMFAFKHANECVTYFINDSSSNYHIDLKALEQSFAKQLSFYISSQREQSENESLSSLMYRTFRKSSKQGKPLYFVLDGFSNIPSECKEMVKNLLSAWFSNSHARFLLSGQSEDIKEMLPDGISIVQSNTVLPFQDAEIKDLLCRVIPNVSNEEIDLISRFSNGNAEKIHIIIEKFFLKKTLDFLSIMYMHNVQDLFEEEWENIIRIEDKNLLLGIGLLVYSEYPLCENIFSTLFGNENDIFNKIQYVCPYFVINNGVLGISSISLKKYLRKKLLFIKSEVEILLIGLLEKDNNVENSFRYLPSLYRSNNKKTELVNYLSSEKVQQFLEDKKSQAALNEQCEYGFNACTDFDSQAGEQFRFALNRSSSREIEKNTLSDGEIDALIAIGEEESAYALAQKVFLLEERLKSLLIIARSSTHMTDSMQKELKEQICLLANSIDFEHIPDKAMELAKLMLPIDFVTALTIIDKIGKQKKDKLQLDTFYATLSLSYNAEGEGNTDEMSKIDIINTRIEDDGIKKMANAMKSIMKDCTPEELLLEIEKLPTTSSRLYFLQFWIPDHAKSEGIERVVRYAVKLVIETANINIPKVSLLANYCKPISQISNEGITDVITQIDAVISSIKYPTLDYVDLQLLLVQALGKTDKKKAEERLMNLYFDITKMEDKSLAIHCKSKILGKFDKLGNRADVENWLMPSFELQKELTNEILDQFTKTAYHLKVVEVTIKELVCCYPSLIDDVVCNMNTAERRCKAYLLALNEYISQTKIEKINWNYFQKLYDNITFDKSDLEKALIRLVRKIVNYEGEKSLLLQQIKKHYSKLKEIEIASPKCYVLSMLYVWFRVNFQDDSFGEIIKRDLDKTWECISVPFLKVETGYQIAKQLSKIPFKEEAREYVKKLAEERKHQLLSSFSCMTAYQESLSLYIHSLGILIRSSLCRDEDLKQLELFLNYDDSKGDAMVAWSQVALEYLLAKNKNKFNEIITAHVSLSLDDFSPSYRKYVFYHISPALFYLGDQLFFSKLSAFDEWFRNICLENIALFIRTKYPYSGYNDSKEEGINTPLEYDDFERLLKLIDNSTDECFIFNQTKIVSHGLKDNLGNKVSREQITFLFSWLEKLIQKKLPTKNGIQHNGYLIACNAIINGCKPNSSYSWINIMNEISTIPNVADRAFLYSHVSHYVKKTEDKGKFMERALAEIDSLSSSFDRMNRYDMCLQEAFTTLPSKSKAIAKKAMESMLADKNGSFNDIKKMIDYVRDHDEQLADDIIDMIDKDPARSTFKRKLKLHQASRAKIQSAKDNISKVLELNNEEQMAFFEKQLEILIKRRTVYRDIENTSAILATVYRHPISNTSNAILYFMENLYLKHSLNQKHTSLIKKIHESILFNLKIVLAIASGTKERMERINRIMSENNNSSSMFVRVGEFNRGFEILKEWYKKNPHGMLRIIDPYFHADDMSIIKTFFDENNNLAVSILTHLQNYPDISSFQKGWNQVSADMTGSIHVTTVCFDDDKCTCPIHDRWWVLYDSEENVYVGLRLESPSGFGKRDSEISEMNQLAIDNFNKLWNDYVLNNIRKVGERRLDYDSIILK